MVRRSGSPGPAPTSVTLPSARPDSSAPAKADASGISFSAASASSLRPARTSAPIGPSTTRSQKRRRSGNSGMRTWIDLRQRPKKVAEESMPAADEMREVTDACRQNRFDALAYAARHHRRSTAGTDRNDDIAAINDRRKNESRMRQVVHHINGHADRLRPRRHRKSNVARTGA